jgi:phosphatidylserine decarboxylase
VGAWSVVALLVVLALTGRWVWLVLWLPIAVWVVAFFRDPERAGPRGDDLVIAPADGKVVSIVDVDEPAFFGERATRISIFMNVFDCHVNRYPADGCVAYRQYSPGRFLNAADDKASLENEQSSVGLTGTHGKMLVRQIAGLIARRIVTDHAVGATVRQGERLGMIRFGSRVDLFLPRGTPVLVREGDTARVGVTQVARWS